MTNLREDTGLSRPHLSPKHPSSEEALRLPRYAKRP